MIFSDILHEDVGPDTAIEKEELMQIIRSISNCLSPVQHMVFVLADLEELPREEVAELCGISTDSVKSNLHLARTKVREKLVKLMEETVYEP